MTIPLTFSSYFMIVFFIKFKVLLHPFRFSQFCPSFHHQQSALNRWKKMGLVLCLDQRHMKWWSFPPIQTYCFRSARYDESVSYGNVSATKLKNWTKVPQSFLTFYENVNCPLPPMFYRYIFVKVFDFLEFSIQNIHLLSASVEKSTSTQSKFHDAISLRINY